MKMIGDSGLSGLKQEFCTRTQSHIILIKVNVSVRTIQITNKVCRSARSLLIVVESVSKMKHLVIVVQRQM